MKVIIDSPIYGAGVGEEIDLDDPTAKWAISSGYAHVDGNEEDLTYVTGDQEHGREGDPTIPTYAGGAGVERDSEGEVVKADDSDGDEPEADQQKADDKPEKTQQRKNASVKPDDQK